MLFIQSARLDVAFFAQSDFELLLQRFQAAVKPQFIVIGTDFADVLYLALYRADCGKKLFLKNVITACTAQKPASFVVGVRRAAHGADFFRRGRAEKPRADVSLILE